MVKSDNRAFSLLEVTLVVLIVVTVSTMAFKKFIYVIERARTVEALNVLRSIKNAQTLNMDITGSYVGDGEVHDFPMMLSYSDELEYFNRVEVTTNPLELGRVFRSNGAYHLNITDLGVIYCIVDAGNYNLCEKLGYKEVPIGKITELPGTS